MTFKSKNQFEEAVTGAIADLIDALLGMNLRLKHCARRFKRRVLYSHRIHRKEELLNKLYKDALMGRNV